MKYRCAKEILSAGGDQEFEVEAETLADARKLFAGGKAELVVSNCEVTHLSEFNLDDIWIDN